MHPKYANGDKIKFGDIIKGEPVTWMKVFSDKSWIVGGDCYETEGSKDDPLKEAPAAQETSEIMPQLRDALEENNAKAANYAMRDFVSSLGYKDVACLYDEILGGEWHDRF